MFTKLTKFLRKFRFSLLHSKSRNLSRENVNKQRDCQNKMAGLEDFYPELRQRYAEDRPASAGSKSTPASLRQTASHRSVPMLIEKPPRLVEDQKKDQDEIDNYSNIALSTVGILLQNIGTHPFIVLRRQCQVSAESYRRHRTPATLIPVMVHIYRLQGFSSMWKGLGSALTVRGLVLGVEDCTGKLTPWPTSVDSTSSPRMLVQHLMLKSISHALVVPFFSASLVESVQSDIASEKPGMLDFLKEGLLRLGPQSGRTLPMWQLVFPSVIHSTCHYIISVIFKTVSEKIMKSRHRSLQEQQGAISKRPPPGLTAYREQVSSIVGILAADIILYPVETVLHRLHLQGTRTIIDNLETGREVVPIITRYEGFLDCFQSIITEEGFSGLFKGFGALMLQYGLQFLVLRLTFSSLKEVLKLMTSENVPTLPPEYAESHNTPRKATTPVKIPSPEH